MRQNQWQIEDVERHLKNLAVDGVIPGAPEMTDDILIQARSRRRTRRLFPALAAVVAAAAVLLLVPASMVALGRPVLEIPALGIRVAISSMDPTEWMRQGFSNWLASPGAPEFLSPEETAQVASFPVRTPGWVPEGYEAVGRPQGAFAHHYEGGRWHKGKDPEHFFVSQGFRTVPEGGSLSILQKELYARGEVTLAPGTQVLEVAGHPAFLELDVPFARADQESENRSKRGDLPEIVRHENQLTLWVTESTGQVTEITLSGSLSAEELIKVASSLFD